jgi:hypothetical protein
MQAEVAVLVKASPIEDILTKASNQQQHPVQNIIENEIAEPKKLIKRDFSAFCDCV